MTPLEFQGPAQLAHINARKEGLEGEKILAADLKFALTMHNDILIAFHPQLRLMLFTRDGEPRFPLMGEIEWDYEFRDMVLELESGTPYTASFSAVRLKKWRFLPRSSHKVYVVFQAQVQPDDGQFERLGQFLLADTVRINVYSANGDLFGAKDAAPQGESGRQSADAGDRAIVSRSDGLHTPPISASSPAAPIEINESLIAFMRAAGRAEAKKLEDERDFDRGFIAACLSAKLSKEFVDEHFSALESAYADGFEKESAESEDV